MGNPVFVVTYRNGIDGIRVFGLNLALLLIILERHPHYGYDSIQVIVQSFVLRLAFAPLCAVIKIYLTTVEHSNSPPAIIFPMY